MRLAEQSATTDIVSRVLCSPEAYDNYNQAFEDVAEMRSASALRFARPLPEDAEKLFDQTVVRVGRERLRVMAEVQDRGLRFPLPNWLFVPNLQGDKINDFGVAEEVYDLRSNTENQLPDRTPYTTPIFAQLANFSWGIRELGASQRSGQPLNTESIEQGTRRINELMENQSIFGSTLTINGNSAAGLNNAPNLGSFNFQGNLAWDNASKTMPNIVVDVLTGIQVLRDAGKNDGPYTLFINSTYENVLQRRFATNNETAETTQQAIERLYQSEGGVRVVASGKIAANVIFIAQMTTDVMDVIDGDQPTVINWSPEPRWTSHVAIVGCQILRTKDDYDGNSGIVRGTPN